MNDCIFNLIKRLRLKIRGIVKRATVTLPGDDSGPYNITQISYAEPKKTAAAEVVSPYGLCVNLPKDIQVILFTICSDEENRACIGYSQADRFKNLKEGEVLVGNPQTGSFIKFNVEGGIEIDSKQAVDITVTGDVDLKAVNVNIDATKVNLGVGGNDIARSGDPVSVNTSTGIGTITSGGTNTSI